MCVLRSRSGESLFLPSRCPHCFRDIAWHDLVPLFSFFFLLRGECRYCKNPIAWQYPCVELFSAIGFAALYYFDGFSLSYFYHVGVFLLFLVIAAGDFLFQEIDDRHIVFSLVWVLGWQFYFGNYSSALFGGGLGFLISGASYFAGRLLYKTAAYGLGDVFLTVVVGAVVGTTYLLPVYAIALALHIVFAYGRRYFLRQHANEAVPFGPPLVLATALIQPINALLLLY